MASGSDFSDGFDRLPDPIILLILNQVSDIKTLLCCRSVSKRLNSLVPQSDSVLLRVDRVIPTFDDDDEVSFLSSIFKTLLHLIPFQKPDNLTRLHNSPSRILRSFDAIKNLRIELPSGDLHFEKGTSVKWVARFGKTLHSCVILTFRNKENCENLDSISGSGGLKMRVVWTISALISASARHYMIGDVIKEQHSLSHVVVTDRENEGSVIMDKEGLREFRDGGDCDDEMEDEDMNNRTRVPAVKIRMRHSAKLELSGGVVMEGATLVVVRPADVVVGGGEVEEQSGDVGLAAEAFGKEGVCAETVERLLTSRTYILEMNSF